MLCFLKLNLLYEGIDTIDTRVDRTDVRAPYTMVYFENSSNQPFVQELRSNRFLGEITIPQCEHLNDVVGKEQFLFGSTSLVPLGVLA